MSYPRMCRGSFGPHLVAGPDDEILETGKRPVCRVCRIATRPAKFRRYRESPGGAATIKRFQNRWTESGASATAALKYSRKKAEARDLQLLEDLRGPNESRQG